MKNIYFKTMLKVQYSSILHSASTTKTKFGTAQFSLFTFAATSTCFLATTFDEFFTCLAGFRLSHP